MTVTEYVETLLAITPPVSSEVIETAARILASVGNEQVAA